MLRYKKEQQVCDIGGLRVGGQPGENPPLLVGNMFQKGDALLKSRKHGEFDRREAEVRIRELETVSQETGVPGIVALVANTADEIKGYIDFFTSVTDLPFAVDIWQQKTRLAAARYVAQLGIQERVLYNSITPWDEDTTTQVSELKELGIKHVVIQAFDTNDKTAAGRVTSLKELLPSVQEGGFESVLVDTAAMNLPAMSLSMKANHLIKTEFGLPVGFAPSNGSYMWRKSAEEASKKKFPAVDAGAHAACALVSDFLFYGPMSGTPRVFAAVAAASAMTAALAYEETGALPSGTHPLCQMFPDVLEQFRKEQR